MKVIKVMNVFACVLFEYCVYMDSSILVLGFVWYGVYMHAEKPDQY